MSSVEKGVRLILLLEKICFYTAEENPYEQSAPSGSPC